MRDVILAIRADEAHHRVVNHTLSSLPLCAPNPFLPGEKKLWSTESNKYIGEKYWRIAQLWESEQIRPFYETLTRLEAKKLLLNLIGMYVMNPVIMNSF